MKVLNSSTFPRGVHFKRGYFIMEPGEVVEINPFNLTDLGEISEYVRDGVFTLIDEEDEDIDDEYFRFYSGKKIAKEASVFSNINFDNDIGDF